MVKKARPPGRRSPPTPEQLVGRARELAPVLRERAQATEALRRLPDETMRALYDAGFLRILQPKRYGGYGMGWGPNTRVARELAKVCPSTAWIIAVVGMHSTVVARLPKRCQDAVWGTSEDMLISTGSAQTTGTIRKTAEGYRVAGTWRFASGVDHAPWVMVAGRVETEDGSAHPNARVLFPKGEIEVVDTWYVEGMCGTGSKDINVPDVLVPEWRVENAMRNFGANPPGAAVNDDYLCQVPFQPYFSNALFSVIVGSAEGAYMDYLEITGVRKGAIFGNPIRELAHVQQRLAESSAEIKSAGLLYDWAVRLLHERGIARSGLSASDSVELARDRAFIAKLCVGAVTRLVRQMGAMGLGDDNPVQRHYRDQLVMASQIGANWDHHGTAFGRHAFGLAAVTPGGGVTAAAPAAKN